MKQVFSDTPNTESYKIGLSPTLTCLINGYPSRVTIDTGAIPTVITALYLSKRDPSFHSRLTPASIKTADGFGGTMPVLGMYHASVVLPHRLGSLSLAMNLLVIDVQIAPYAFIIGREYQTIYAINVVNAPDPGKTPYVSVSNTKQRFAIAKYLASTEIAAIYSPPPTAPEKFAEPFPSGRPDVQYKDFVDVLKSPDVVANGEFHEALSTSNINKDLSEEQTKQIVKLILAHQDVFALPNRVYKFAQLGEPVHLEATIPTPMPKGLKKAPYALSHKAKADVRADVRNKVERGLIRPSRSPYAAPTFVVYRGDKVRIVHDWREMNKCLRIPAHPIPNMSAMIRTLRASKYFSSFDIMDAFFMMALDETSKELTAFATEDGLWEYNVCSFGLAPFPGEFSSRLNKEFQVAILQEWLKTYIDDILAQGKTWEDHLWQIYIVLHTLQALGAKIKLSKAFFGFFELTWVGHRLNGLFLTLDEGRIAAIQQWPQPKSKLQVQRFLGFCGYHQQFIQAYASMAKPLSDLTGSAGFQWGNDQDKAFARLKNALSEAVLLFMPDFSKPFVIYTDACVEGLAAALYQKDEEGAERPLVFISRKLKPAESRYGASNLECLAVIWALDKLHFYLDGAVFTVITDCVAVSNLLTCKWISRQLVRWQAALQAYHGRITIKHRAGKLNFNADPPSRDPLPNDATNPAADLDPDQTIEIGGLQFSLEYDEDYVSPCPLLLGERDAEANSISRLDFLSHQVELPDPPFYQDSETAEVKLAAIASSGLGPEFARAIHDGYQADESFKKLYEFLQDSSEGLETFKAKHKDTLGRSIVKSLDEGGLFILDSLVYRRTGVVSTVVVVDKETQTLILDSCHDHLLSGHYGVDKPLSASKISLGGLAFARQWISTFTNAKAAN